MVNNAVQTNKIDESFNTAGEALNQGKAIQVVQTPYQTAVAIQKPRNLREVEKKCLDEAALAGDTCYYGWGSGKDRIEGPSISCAMIALRNFGNCAVASRPVIETPTAFIFTSAFIDLETGVTYERQFRQSKKSIVYGKHDEARKEDIRFQIGQSKADRNAVLRAVPSWLTDKMVEEAKAGVREQIERFVNDPKKGGIEAARKRAFDALSKYGVKIEQIEIKLDKKYAAWDIECLVILQGDIKALTTGTESADALYPKPDEQDEQAEKSDLEKSMIPGDPATHHGYDKPNGATDTKSTPPTKDQEFELDDLAKQYRDLGGFTQVQLEGYLKSTDGKDADWYAAEIEAMRKNIAARAPKSGKAKPQGGTQTTLGEDGKQKPGF